MRLLFKKEFKINKLNKNKWDSKDFFCITTFTITGIACKGQVITQSIRWIEGFTDLNNALSVYAVSLFKF